MSDSTKATLYAIGWLFLIVIMFAAAFAFFAFTPKFIIETIFSIFLICFFSLFIIIPIRIHYINKWEDARKRAENPNYDQYKNWGCR